MKTRILTITLALGFFAAAVAQQPADQLPPEGVAAPYPNQPDPNAPMAPGQQEIPMPPGMPPGMEEYNTNLVAEPMQLPPEQPAVEPAATGERPSRFMVVRSNTPSATPN